MKLTDTQLVLLSAASQRENHAIELPENLKGGAAHKVIAKLLTEGLVEEIRARGALPVWRRDDAEGAFALRITRRGLKAIGVADASDATRSTIGTSRLHSFSSSRVVTMGDVALERDGDVQRILFSQNVQLPMVAGTGIAVWMTVHTLWWWKTRRRSASSSLSI